MTSCKNGMMELWNSAIMEYWNNQMVLFRRNGYTNPRAFSPSMGEN